MAELVSTVEGAGCWARPDVTPTRDKMEVGACVLRRGQ